MSRRWTPIALVVAMMVFFGVTLGAAAQSVTLPVTPDPATCDLSTVPTIQDLLTRAGLTPVPDAQLTPPSAASPAPFTLPAGTAADQATIDGITATMTDILACQNTGSLLGGFALSTDNFVNTFFAASPLSESSVAAINEAVSTPASMPSDQYASLIAVDKVTVLADGRVGALVSVKYPQNTPATTTKYLTFAKQAGKWLLDAESQDLPELAATPVA